mgnify:FL=1
MAETQTVIKIDRELWKHFRAGCILHDTAPTHEISQFITAQLDQWAREAPKTSLDESPVRKTEGHAQPEKDAVHARIW